MIELESEAAQATEAATDGVATAESMPALGGRGAEIAAITRRLAKADKRFARESGAIDRIERPCERAGATSALALYTAAELEAIRARLGEVAESLRRSARVAVALFTATGAELATHHAALACATALCDHGRGIV